MNLFETPWDVISPLAIWVIGLPLLRVVGRCFGSTSRRSFLLYIWHTIWCLLYCAYSLGEPADSVGYYAEASTTSPVFSWGTSFVGYLTYLLASPLGLSYVSCFLVFNIIGSIGYICFDSMVRPLSELSSRLCRGLINFIIFLPSISFWSAAIGKDAIAFTAAVLALWASLSLGNRWRLAILAIALMLLVRPHMAALLLMALTANIVFSRGISLIKRYGLFLLCLAASVYFLPLSIQYAGFADGLSTSELSSYIETRQGYNQQGAGAVDISGLPVPLQMLAYLFRPLFFDASSALSIASSVENLVLALFFLFVLYCLRKGLRLPARTPAVFLVGYGLSAWFVLALTTSNMGIALRQKWMFLPFLLYLGLLVTGRYHLSRYQSQRGS